jgi:hypothetical protein
MHCIDMGGQHLLVQTTTGPTVSPQQQSISYSKALKIYKPCLVYQELSIF